MSETIRKDCLPFYHVPDGKIEEGLHSDIYGLDDNWVIKKIKPFWKKGDWKERLTQDFSLLDRYLNPFIPSTTFIECSEDGLTNTLLIVQKRIIGRPLRVLSWDELVHNRTVVEGLIEFGDCVEQMYKETGMTPDLHGGTRNILRQYDFKYSNNLLIDKTAQIWWTDIDRLGPLWSPNWIGGKIHMALMMRSLSRFIYELQAHNHKL